MSESKAAAVEGKLESVLIEHGLKRGEAAIASARVFLHGEAFM